MNAEERDALRSKHRPMWADNGTNLVQACIGCLGLSYPCDVIKVLDDQSQ